MLIHQSKRFSVFYFKSSARVLVVKFNPLEIVISRYRVLADYRLELVHRVYRAYC